MALKQSILWGVNAHNNQYKAYNDQNTDEIIRLAADLGSTIFRINDNPTSPGRLAYIRNVIRQCHARGMQVMLAMDWFAGSVEEIVHRMTVIARELKDEVEYFQLFNETDCWAACKDKEDGGGLYDITDPTGQTPGYFNPKRVPIAIEKMKAAADVWHKEAPNAKLVINIGARHYPMLEWYRDAGITWDVVGVDIYEPWDYHAFFRMLEEKFPTCDMMVAECNYPANNGPYKEEDQAAWLREFILTMNEYDSDRLKAVIVYELLDQPNIQPTDKWEGEAHFGLVHVDPDLTITTPKPSYYTVQKLFKGE